MIGFPLGNHVPAPEQVGNRKDSLVYFQAGHMCGPKDFKRRIQSCNKRAGESAARTPKKVGMMLRKTSPPTCVLLWSIYQTMMG